MKLCLSRNVTCAFTCYLTLFAGNCLNANRPIKQDEGGSKLVTKALGTVSCKNQVKELAKELSKAFSTQKSYVLTILDATSH